MRLFAPFRYQLPDRPRHLPIPQVAMRASGAALVYWSLAWAWIALLVYGSLLPFHFAIPAGFRSPHAWLDPNVWWSYFLSTPRGWLHWHRWWHSDAPMNVWLYLPVGLLLRMHARAKLRGGVRQILIPILFGATLSLAVETTQIFLPDRVSSVADIYMNALGTAIGVLLLVPLVRLLRHIIFFIYCRVAPWRRAVANRFSLDRPHPRLAATLAAATAAAVMIQTAMHPAGQQARLVLKPFAAVFMRNYNVGGEELLRELLLWLAVVACFALASRLALGRVRWGLMLLAAGALAVTRLVIDYALGRKADVTDLTMALASVWLCWFILWAVRRAVAVSCRRKQPRDVPFERRHEPHDYEAAGRK